MKSQLKTSAQEGALAACILGLVCSYGFDLPYGPTLVLALGVLFGVALLLRMAIPQKA